MALSADRMRGRIESQSLSATNLVALTTALVFVAQLYVAWKRDGRLQWFGIDDADFLRFGGLSLRGGNPLADPWQLLSAVFVHIGIIHFGFNMFALVNLGRSAEALVGPARFLIAYVVTGVVGFATTVVLSFFSPQGTGTAGASGALFGLMG